jgi:glutamine phosphoribosylpyrophosphate amidotransferase
MCGIFGIVSKQWVEPSSFIQLAESNQHRGNLSFGYLTGVMHEEEGETAVFRHPHPFAPNMVQFESINLALGHIRAPTGGQTNRVEDVHPFASSDALLAHNGLLLNHQQFPQWQLDPNSQVDSQTILGGIQLHLDQGLALVEAIQVVVGQLEGQQACWLWSKPDNALYLWRVMSPIYYTHTEEAFVFSSSRLSTQNNLLPEGGIYRLSPFTLTFMEVAAFSYYSPYRI